MKKSILLILFLFLLLMFCSTDIFARCQGDWSSRSLVNLYKIENKIAAGLKQHLFTNIYATANLEYRSEASDLEFQLGTVYFFPHKILFFRLYCGPGVQISRNEGYQYPYLVLGTNFLFFFSEVVHPLMNNMEPKFRGGLSFRF